MYEICIIIQFFIIVVIIIIGKRIFRWVWFFWELRRLPNWLTHRTRTQKSRTGNCIKKWPAWSGAQIFWANVYRLVFPRSPSLIWTSNTVYSYTYRWQVIILIRSVWRFFFSYSGKYYKNSHVLLVWLYQWQRVAVGFC